MAKFTKQQILTNILKCPVDFIYLFASDSFINSLSGIYRTTVQKKNLLQRKYINTCAIDAGSTFEDWRNRIGEGIKDTYGLTPQEILVRLASGKDVAGKNWKAGVYGVGALYEGFTQNQNVTVNKETGKLMQNGQEISGQTAVYSGSGKVVGYTGTVEGATYQSMKSGKSYYAGTYSTTEGAFNADGTVYNAANSESVYQSISAWLPLVQQLLQWIMSLFNLSAINPQTITASQSDWIKDTRTNSNSLLYFIAGAGIIALLFKK